MRRSRKECARDFGRAAFVVTGAVLALGIGGACRSKEPPSTACGTTSDCFQGEGCCANRCVPLNAYVGPWLDGGETVCAVDAGVADAGVDAGVDAGPDAGADAGVDAGGVAGVPLATLSTPCIWSFETLVSGPTADAGLPSIAADSATYAHVVWIETVPVDAGLETRVVAARQPPDSAWYSDASVLFVVDGGDVSRPKVVADAYNNAVAAWMWSIAGENKIVASRYRVASNTWSSAVVIAPGDSGVGPEEFDVGAGGIDGGGAEGRDLVVWIGDGGGTGAADFDPIGQTWRDVWYLSGGWPGVHSPRVAIDSRGWAVATFVYAQNVLNKTSNGDQYQAFWSSDDEGVGWLTAPPKTLSYAPTSIGVFVATANEINVWRTAVTTFEAVDAGTSVASNISSLDVEMLDSATAVIAWVDAADAGAELWALRYSISGGAAAGPRVLGYRTDAGAVSNLRAVMGTVVRPGLVGLVWMERRPPRETLMSAWFDPDAGAFSEAIEVYPDAGRVVSFDLVSKRSLFRPLLVTAREQAGRGVVISWICL
ncbi:MAG: hypothetical protein HYY84_09145 [Deltaproteobacteria bacterium]|nr:hypothetical protein [Deltaproteobacteria bacterium]